MNNIKTFLSGKNRPIAVGTGLVALDLIYNETTSEPKLMAGGSCGNVLTILSFFGWNSYPIARFKNDIAADAIIKDLTRWRVHSDYISHKNDGSTPIIVEKIKKNRHGKPTHSFYIKCPQCGSFLPRYKPILAKKTPDILESIPKPNIFYFDRVSRSSIEIAKKFREVGALIFFEPPGIRNEEQFLECLRTADIIKYSDDNLRNARDIIENSSVYLIIETQGENGLRFLLNSSNKTSSWKRMEAYPINNIRDTAGAGDWCSAGIINLVGQKGRDHFYSVTPSAIDKALSLGQIIAAMNCQFDGARGIMYNTSKKEYKEIMNNIMKKGVPLHSIKDRDDLGNMNEISCYCPECQKKKKGKQT